VPESLAPQERAVLAVLFENRNRVVGRRELARHAGLAGRNERRCDSLLVGVRRVLGQEGILTVRSRGWMLREEAVARAAELLGAGADR
jgi:DNA-binding response OmpR family regulator